MEHTLDEINEELSKTHDLIRILLDIIENCKKNQKVPIYIDCLCEILYQQSLKANTMLDDYVVEHCDD